MVIVFSHFHHKLTMKMLVNKNMAPKGPLDNTTQKYKTENIESHLSQNLDIFNLLLSCDMKKGLIYYLFPKTLE